MCGEAALLYEHAVPEHARRLIADYVQCIDAFVLDAAKVKVPDFDASAALRYTV